MIYSLFVNINIDIISYLINAKSMASSFLRLQWTSFQRDAVPGQQQRAHSINSPDREAVCWWFSADKSSWYAVETGEMVKGCKDGQGRACSTQLCILSVHD